MAKKLVQIPASQIERKYKDDLTFFGLTRQKLSIFEGVSTIKSAAYEAFQKRS